jgi:hypothetical protein
MDRSYKTVSDSKHQSGDVEDGDENPIAQLSEPLAVISLMINESKLPSTQLVIIPAQQRNH